MIRTPRRSRLATTLVAAGSVLVATAASAQQEAPPSQPPWVMLPAVPSGSAPAPSSAPTQDQAPEPPPPTSGTPALPPPRPFAPPAYERGYPPPPSYYPPYYGPVYEPPPPYIPPPPRLRQRIHNGFYFRLGIGLAYHQSTVSFPVQGATSGVATSTSFTHKLSGAGVALDIAIGGAIAPGFILAADLGGHDANVTSARSASGWVPTGASYSRLGALADWYINPRAGFHVQAGGGFAGVTMFPSDYTVYPTTLSGFELNAGVGWETWVARDWGIGALLRIDYASVHGQVDGGDVSMKLATPLLLFTGTFN